MYNTINDERPGIKRKIQSLETDVTRLENEIKKEWSIIKDFTLPYERAEDGLSRIVKLKSSIKKLHTEIKKLQRKLEKLSLKTN